MKNTTKQATEKTPEKAAKPTVSPEEGVLAKAMVRISPEKAEYVPMFNRDGNANGGKGWFVGVGAPRVPELHKDVRLLLTAAVRSGCALMAVAGGMRVMLSPTGKGGLCFIEKKNATKGEEVYLFKHTNSTEENCKKFGLKVTRNSKGIYVALRDVNGALIFDILKQNFGNNHSPMNFQVHPWDGYTVDMSAVKKTEKVKKAAKTPDAEPPKKDPVNTKDGPEKKTKTPPVTMATSSGAPKVVKKASVAPEAKRAAAG